MTAAGDTDAAPAAVQVLDISTAPFERTLECSRDSLLKAPDWRYRQASHYLEDEKCGDTPVIPSDRLVQYAIRGLRAYGRKHNRRYLFNLWPDMEEVLYYGIAGRNSAVAAEMDTCLIKGWDYGTAHEAGCPVREATYDLYAGLFFDLSGICAVHSWIQDNLFTPHRGKSDVSLLRSHILAYYGGGSHKNNALVLGIADPDEDSIIRRIIKDERNKTLFDYVVRNTRLDRDTYASLMEDALKSMTAQDFQERMKDKDMTGSSSLEELAANLEEGIRAFSQQELDQFNEHGLDFVNQYTDTITRK